MEERYLLFGKLLPKLKDGQKFVLTPNNVADGDNFLIFCGDRQSQTITIHTNRVPYWIDFDSDEPMRLEDCPTSFFRTLLKNIE